MTAPRTSGGPRLRRAGLLAALPAVLLAAGVLRLAGADPIPRAELRSGYDQMSPGNQALQRDDLANPGMLSVLEGEALWDRKVGGRACAGCHGGAAASMRGVAARYPAYDPGTGSPIDLQGKVNQCRTARQDAPPLPYEGRELLALTAYVAHQSRGLPLAPDEDPRLAPYRERGRALFEQRLGQLGIACAACHDASWGRRLGGSTIPQGHPNGYPLYRLEWQALGSLQRRLRNCLTGVRAEPFPYGASEWVELELYLVSRARGLPVETPAVRP